MAQKFSDIGGPFDHARRLWYRVFGGRRNWHNRVFTAGQSIERVEAGWAVRWKGRGECLARCVADLPIRGATASIVASGPSIRRLIRPERLFERPVACVNGSVTLPHDLGCRTTYLVVSDDRFIRDKPDLFRLGAALAEAVVLGPTAVFAAMQLVPEALEHGNIYLREDLTRPFKRPRPSSRQLLDDPNVIVKPDRPNMLFSLDPARGTCPAGTVVYDAIQILFGIGCQELFMFGVDLTDGPRFYREADPAPSDIACAYDRSIEPAFALVAEYLRRSGRRLVNGSLESRLPGSVIPKLDGNELLAELAAPARAA